MINFLKKHLPIISIIVLGLFLRINYDFFIKGFNFDEIAMVSVASQNFPFEILKQSALLDYHAPLYYLLIHPIVKYTDQSWFYLRLLNTLISILNIYVFYKIGSIQCKKTGIICALMLAVNHLSIGVSIFVKFYALCFLLVSTSIYYFLKIINYQKGYIKLGIINTLYIFSSTYGILFVFIQYLILYILKRNKKIITSSLIAIVGFLIYLPILFAQIKTALTNIIPTHVTYPSFSLFAVYDFLNDYFSPLVNYSCNTYSLEARSLIAKAIYNHSFADLSVFVLFSLIPVICAIICIIKSYKNNKDLFKLGIIYLAIFTAISLFQITGFIPLYIYPCGLILIILCCYGINNIKNKFKYILPITIIASQILISNTYNINNRDGDKAKIYYGFEKFYNANNPKMIIATEGGRFLEIYYKNIFNFDYEQASANHNKKLIGLIYGNDLVSKANKNNIAKLVIPIIKNNVRNEEFEKYIIDNIISKLNKGEQIVYSAYAAQVPFLYSEEEQKLILESSNFKTGLLDSSKLNQNNEERTLSELKEAINTYSTQCLIEILEKNLKRIKVEQYSRTKYDDYERNFVSTNYDKPTLWILRNFISGWIFITYEKQ